MIMMRYLICYDYGEGSRLVLSDEVDANSVTEALQSWSCADKGSTRILSAQPISKGLKEASDDVLCEKHSESNYFSARDHIKSLRNKIASIAHSYEN